MEWNWNTMRMRDLKKTVQLWRKRDYHSVYVFLKEKNYNYTIDNLEKDFNKVSSIDKFCYLIYLLSNEYSVKNTLLVCDFLIYTDTFFYDVHPVIRMIIQHAIILFPTDQRLVEWIISTYENHPDSPFDASEIVAFKKIYINKN